MGRFTYNHTASVYIQFHSWVNLPVGILSEMPPSMQERLEGAFMSPVLWHRASHLSLDTWLVRMCLMSSHLEWGTVTTSKSVTLSKHPKKMKTRATRLVDRWLLPYEAEWGKTWNMLTLLSPVVMAIGSNKKQSQGWREGCMNTILWVWRWRTTGRSQSSPATIQVLRLKLSSSGSAASTSPHLAVSPALHHF